MRRRARIDANQPEIVAGLRKIGCSVRHVHQLDDGGGDILVGFRGRNYLFELKDPLQPFSKRCLTEKEQRFREGWRGQIDTIETLEHAWHVLGLN